MPFLVGTDEAGYGPNLGPLVVSATAWEVPPGTTSQDLQRRLSGVVAMAPGQVSADDPPCVVMGDSKLLYQSGKGLAQLEYGLWPALGVLGHCPQRWRDVWELLAPGSAAQHQPVPWYADFDVPVPLDADAARMQRLTAALCQGLGQAGVGLLAVRSRAVFPGEFNGLLDRYGSKGSALSHVTLDLARSVIDRLPEGAISVVCDKHGGRNRYGALLGEHFPDWLIEVRGEHRDWSAYRFGPRQRRIEFRFQVQAESCLPAALASMASKYLRELAMRAWNDYWCCRVPGLEPTAGYPQDARRFKDSIAALQRELAIDDDVVWRKK